MDKSTYKKKILTPLNQFSCLGKEINDIGTKLIGHVPHVAPKAYLNIIYSPLDHEQIKLLENRLERPLPIQFKQFLAFANGMSVFSGSIRILGFVPHKRKAEVHPHNYPGNILISNVQGRIHGLYHYSVVVGFYKFDGSYVCIEETGKAVRFDANGDGKTIQEWQDFDTWIVSEIEYLIGFFDETGHMQGDKNVVFAAH